MNSFSKDVKTANPVFYRTYSRYKNGNIESWKDVCKRTHEGLVELGKFTDDESELLSRMQTSLTTLPSGRWLWVGGTDWLSIPENFYGAYNCTSTDIIDWESFSLIMGLTMVGCGCGAIVEADSIKKLPTITNSLNLEIIGNFGGTPKASRQKSTKIESVKNEYKIIVGDSRQGWVDAYRALLELSSNNQLDGCINICIDISHVRSSGERLKGFGGLSNPVGLPQMFERVVAILNKAVGRKLNSVECCLLINEAALAIVAGNIRRSANIQQGSQEDEIFANAKFGLWQKDDEGNWRIDPERDALRMANHTRVFHRKPSYDEILESIRNQYYSGEGAIQYAPEAIARANADIFGSPLKKRKFLKAYECQTKAGMFNWMRSHFPKMSSVEIKHRLNRYGLNPCGK